MATCDRMAPVPIRTKGWATMAPPQNQARPETSTAGVFTSDVLSSRTPDAVEAYPLKPLPASPIRLDTWKQAAAVLEAERLKHSSDFKLKVGHRGSRSYRACTVCHQTEQTQPWQQHRVQEIARVYPRALPPPTSVPTSPAYPADFGSWDCLGPD